MDYERATNLLAQPLDPKHVHPPKKFGPKGDYIEGWHAIAEANRIFGPFGWSEEILNLEKASLTEGKDNNGKPQWQAAYTCLIRVKVGDVVREDVGFGSGFAKGLGDAVEGATKEAVTDALKRALRTFGNPFGLALYDKTKKDVRKPEQERKAMAPADMRDWIKAKLAALPNRQAVLDFWTNDRIVTAYGSLPAPMQLELDKAYSDALAKFPADEPVGLPDIPEMGRG